MAVESGPCDGEADRGDDPRDVHVRELTRQPAELDEVRLDRGLRQLELQVILAQAESRQVRLDGRVGWRSNAGHREFFTQQLAFTGRGGARFDPTDFRLVLDAATAAMQHKKWALRPDPEHVRAVEETAPLLEGLGHEVVEIDPR